jgi:superfamily II DNA or RNA helicase
VRRLVAEDFSLSFSFNKTWIGKCTEHLSDTDKSKAGSALNQLWVAAKDNEPLEAHERYQSLMQRTKPFTIGTTAGVTHYSLIRSLAAITHLNQMLTACPPGHELHPSVKTDLIENLTTLQRLIQTSTQQHDVSTALLEELFGSPPNFETLNRHWNAVGGRLNALQATPSGNTSISSEAEGKLNTAAATAAAAVEPTPRKAPSDAARKLRRSSRTFDDIPALCDGLDALVAICRKSLPQDSDALKPFEENIQNLRNRFAEAADDSDSTYPRHLLSAAINLEKRVIRDLGQLEGLSQPEMIPLRHFVGKLYEKEKHDDPRIFLDLINHRNGSFPLELRRYQWKALEHILSWYDFSNKTESKSGHEQFIQMPTGAGKSRLMVAVHLWLLSHKRIDRQKAIPIYTSPLEEINFQNVESIYREMHGYWHAQNWGEPKVYLKADSQMIARVRESLKKEGITFHTTEHVAEADAIMGTTQGLGMENGKAIRRVLSDLKTARKTVSLLNMDEYHHRDADTCDAIATALHDIFPDAKLLGFTATPRSDQTHPLFSLSLRQAIDRGIVPDLRIHQIRSQFPLGKLNAKAGGDFSDGDLARALNTDTHHQEILKHIEQRFSRKADDSGYAPGLLFFPTLAHCGDFGNAYLKHHTQTSGTPEASLDPQYPMRGRRMSAIGADLTTYQSGKKLSPMTAEQVRQIVAKNKTDPRHGILGIAWGQGDGGMNKAAYAETMAACRNGDVENLAGCKKFKEGFNWPEARNLLLCPTLTPENLIQMLGRVCRWNAGEYNPKTGEVYRDEARDVLQLIYQVYSEDNRTQIWLSDILGLPKEELFGRRVRGSASHGEQTVGTGEPSRAGGDSGGSGGGDDPRRGPSDTPPSDDKSDTSSTPSGIGTTDSSETRPTPLVHATEIKREFNDILTTQFNNNTAVMADALGIPHWTLTQFLEGTHPDSLSLTRMRRMATLLLLDRRRFDGAVRASCAASHHAEREHAAAALLQAFEHIDQHLKTRDDLPVALKAYWNKSGKLSIRALENLLESPEALRSTIENLSHVFSDPALSFDHHSFFETMAAFLKTTSSTLA